MADNSSNSVAIVAIVIILLLAGVGVWYFTKGGTVTDSTNVEVTTPDTSTAPSST